MYKRKRAGNTITRKINSTKDTAAKADKNHYISNSYLEGFIPIDTEYFTASFSQSGFESTEWKAAESSSHHCVCCTDPFDFAHNGGGENRRPLDRCVPDRPVVTD